MTDARASDSMFLFIDFVRVTNFFNDFTITIMSSLGGGRNGTPAENGFSLIY